MAGGSQSCQPSARRAGAASRALRLTLLLRCCSTAHTYVLRQQVAAGNLVPDLEPTELDFSSAGGGGAATLAERWEASAAGLRPQSNPKNGTPWFRFRSADGAGQASHGHFGGLRAQGSFPADVLRAHNVVRHRAGLRLVSWSSGLASLASQRVHRLTERGCYIRHSSLEDRWQQAGFEYVGENLYKVINMVPTGVDIVDAWYAEIQDYSYGPVGASCTKGLCAGRSSPPCTLGHFTQVMWADTTHVGCALAECSGQAKRTFIASCNYGPGGNIVGRMPFPASEAVALGFSAQNCAAAGGGAGALAASWRSGAEVAGARSVLSAVALAASAPMLGL
mmetsp:Transcript_8278/g.18018  ORF Transcript_8278/g.18018 Transcript_8278/m.18018 type:complete len:336 (-) Transcript_8278:82-1089(-)